MRRNITRSALAIGLAATLALGAALATSGVCSRWNPISHHCPDPELTKLIR